MGKEDEKNEKEGRNDYFFTEVLESILIHGEDDVKLCSVHIK